MSLSSLKGNIIAVDTETTGLNPWGSYARYGFYPARPFAFSFCDEKGNTAYIRWEVNPKTRQVIPERKTLKAMSQLLGDPSIVKVGHNLMFDIRMSRKSGIKFNWKLINDTQFMAHVYTGGGLKNYKLKYLSEIFLGISDQDQKDLLDSVKATRRKVKNKNWKLATAETHGTGYINSDYWLGNPELCKKYATLDAERTMLLYLGFIKYLQKYPELEKIYLSEIKLAKAVYKMEHRGVKIDKLHLIELKKYYEKYAKSWLKKAHKLGGQDLNFNSPKQMVEKFCHEKKYKTKKKTKTGQPSIDNAELQRLAEIQKDPLAKAILEYKGAMGMITKFINPYNKFMVKQKNNWVLHPNFRQCGPITGRFSCSDPNLMQVADEKSIKKKADIALKPRELFCPRPGYIWYLPDFSQMEVWVFAFQAKDKIMTKALLSGKDFHSITAEYIWGEYPDWERNKKKYRKKGKTMMFLKQYGGGVRAASELLNCSAQEAQDTIDIFDRRLPGVNMFIEKISYQAEIEGDIKNAFGRAYKIDRDQYYKAVNYLVQGTCADLMKRAMIRLDKFFRKNHTDCHLLLTLHDELIIEVPRALHSKTLQNKIIKLMQKDSAKVGIPVPMPITMKITETRWSAAKEVL
jgi:DNA polymerase-1